LYVIHNVTTDIMMVTFTALYIQQQLLQSMIHIRVELSWARFNVPPNSL